MIHAFFSLLRRMGWFFTRRAHDYDLYNPSYHVSQTGIGTYQVTEIYFCRACGCSIYATKWSVARLQPALKYGCAGKKPVTAADAEKAEREKGLSNVELTPKGIRPAGSTNTDIN